MKILMLQALFFFRKNYKPYYENNMIGGNIMKLSMKDNMGRKERKNDELLSMKALSWLHSAEVNYDDKEHEERMVLFKAARILFPDDIEA